MHFQNVTTGGRWYQVYAFTPDLLESMCDVVCVLSSNECSKGFLHICSYKGVIICDYILLMLPVFFQLLLTPRV